MKEDNKIFGKKNRALLRRRKEICLDKVHTSHCSSQGWPQSDGHPVNMSTDGVHVKHQMSWQVPGVLNAHSHSEAMERLDGPEALSTYANLHHVESQQHPDSMASSQKRDLLNITLGGQSKLSRPISSYRKFDEAERGSPEVQDGIGSDEEDDEDGQPAHQEAVIAAQAQRQPGDDQPRQSLREHRDGSPTSLDHLTVDIQDFNTKIQRHLPIAIHAQESLNEESTEKQIALDNIISPIVESPRARRSTLSHQNVEKVNSISGLSAGNAALNAQPSDLWGQSSLADTRKNQHEQIISKVAASQLSVGPDSEASPGLQRIHNSESSGDVAVCFTNDRGRDAREVATIEED